MKTQKGSVVIILLVILLIAGGGYWYIKSETEMTPNVQVSEEQKEIVEKEPVKEPIVDKSSKETTEQIIVKKSDQIISLLKNKSVAPLKDFVHPIKGVRISNDGYIDVQRDVIVKVSEMDSLIKNDAKLLWGYTNGKGDAINLSLEDYFSRYLSIDFTKSQKTYNQVVSGGSNTIALDIQNVYTNNNFVNYYIPYNSTYMDEGVEKPQTMDWRGLNLVFEEYNGELYLIGIISDNWTI